MAKVRGECGVCAWCRESCQDADDKCPHGFACCLNCPDCKE